MAIPSLNFKQMLGSLSNNPKGDGASSTSAKSAQSGGGVPQYSYNNFPFEVKFTLDNGVDKVDINPQAIIYLNIVDSLSKWYVEGEIALQYSYDMIENAHFFPTGADGDLGKYVFRNDGFDFLKISIKPTDPSDKNESTRGVVHDKYADMPQHLLHLNLWMSIYRVQDLLSPFAGDNEQNVLKYKKFYFRDYRYQKMSTTIAEYSTALSPNIVTGPSVVADTARSIPTSTILHELITSTQIDDALKKTAKEVNKPEEWDKSGGVLFYTAGANETIADSIDYVLQRHISEEGFSYPMHIPIVDTSGACGGGGTNANPAADSAQSGTVSNVGGGTNGSLAAVAAKDIGLHEDGKSNRGPQIQKFFDASGVAPGSYWCAAAVSYWVQEWIKGNNIPNVKPPREGSCFQWQNWAKRNNIPLSMSPSPGDVVVYKKSHIGVVDSVNGSSFSDISGNTTPGAGVERNGGGVYKKNQSMSSVLHFIKTSTLGPQTGHDTPAAGTGSPEADKAAPKAAGSSLTSSGGTLTGNQLPTGGVGSTVTTGPNAGAAGTSQGPAAAGASSATPTTCAPGGGSGSGGASPPGGAGGDGSSELNVAALPPGLKPLAPDFIAAGKKYNIDPNFLAAISWNETGGGTSKAFKTGNNAMGTSNAKGPIYGYASPGECIDKQARGLTRPDGYYKNCTTIGSVGNVYSPVGAANDPRGLNSSWIPTVGEKYNKLTGKGTNAVVLGSGRSSGGTPITSGPNAGSTAAPSASGVATAPTTPGEGDPARPVASGPACTEPTTPGASCPPSGGGGGGGSGDGGVSGFGSPGGGTITSGPNSGSTAVGGNPAKGGSSGAPTVGPDGLPPNAAKTDNTACQDPRETKIQYTCYGGPMTDLTTLCDIIPSERPPEAVAKWGGEAKVNAIAAKMAAGGKAKPGVLHLADAYRGCYGPLILGKTIGSCRWPGGTVIKFTRQDGSLFNPTGLNAEGIYTVTDYGAPKKNFTAVDFFTDNEKPFLKGAQSELLNASVITMGSKTGPNYHRAHKLAASGEIPSEATAGKGSGASSNGSPDANGTGAGGAKATPGSTENTSAGGAGNGSAGGPSGGGNGAPIPSYAGTNGYQDRADSETKIHDVCLLTINRGPTEADYGYFATRALKDYFKNAGKTSPGNLQMEHFYIQAMVGDSTGMVPMAPRGTEAKKLIDVAIAGKSTIKNYKFVDISAEFNAQEFVSRPVHTFNMKTRNYKINYESHTVEMARKFIAEHYIKELFSEGGDDEEKFLVNINRDKKEKKNLRPVYTFLPDDSNVNQTLGIHKLLKSGIFQNACINFDIPGETYREPGTFAAIEKLEGGRPDSTFDTRFYGQWFIIKVLHYFTESEYYNNITAVKIHRHRAIKSNFPDY